MWIIRVLVVVLAGTALALTATGVYYLIEPPAGPDGPARYVPAVMMFVFAALVLVIFLPTLRRIGGQHRLLRTGEPATATVVEVADTGTTINQQPQFRFTLDVQRADGSTYRATVKQVVARTSLGLLRPGLVVPVRVDPRRPQRVAIDSRAGTASASAGTPGAVPAGTPGAAPLTGSGMPHASTVMRASDVVRDGVPTTATVRAVALTGTTAGQVQPTADPAIADDPMVTLVLDVTLADGRTVTTQFLQRVPKDQLAQLTPGASLPVAYLAADPIRTTSVDWERLADT